MVHSQLKSALVNNVLEVTSVSVTSQNHRITEISTINYPLNPRSDISVIFHPNTKDIIKQRDGENQVHVSGITLMYCQILRSDI